jgi:hypothetical protein
MNEKMGMGWIGIADKSELENSNMKVVASLVDSF